MPLIYADVGKEYTIVRLSGSAEVKKHLNDLGFTTGGTVRLISVVGGNVIVNVKEARIAIGRDLAKRIIV